VADFLLFNFLAAAFLGLYHGMTRTQWTLGTRLELQFDGLLVQLLISWAAAGVVVVLCWLLFRGTPGKLLMGCQVGDARGGGPLRLSQAVLRYIGYLVAVLPAGVGFLWVAWDKRKQGFHDKLARTVVIVDDDSRKSLAELERELKCPIARS
jgi:uncharacterized RDD family membrane protein YckC